MAEKLEGTVRNVGKHAGGVVIAPTALTDFVPLYADHAGGAVVSQFDLYDVEEAGLVKFDFLGLRTLTIIDWAVAAINAERADRGENALDIENVPLDDAQTYEFLKTAHTTAVFQLESAGMKELVARLKPDSIEDIIALVALFSPRDRCNRGRWTTTWSASTAASPCAIPIPGWRGRWSAPTGSCCTRNR